jgi:hypothetical protein
MGPSFCPTRTNESRYSQAEILFIDICTKYGFCEEVVYKLKEPTNLIQIIANLLSINDYLINVQTCSK